MNLCEETNMVEVTVKEYVVQLEKAVNIRNLTIESHKKAEQVLLEQVQCYKAMAELNERRIKVLECQVERYQEGATIQ